MSSYVIREVREPGRVAANEVILIASGDLRESANEKCWPAQSGMEAGVVAAFEAEGVKVSRAHSYDPARHHGFISSQRMGMDVFMGINPDAPVVVAEAVWQYSHNVFSGLILQL
jgi:hypothetical protein